MVMMFRRPVDLMVVVVVMMVAAAVTLAGLMPNAAGAAGVVPPRDPVSNTAPVPAYNTIAGRSYIVGSRLPPCWQWRGSQLFAVARSGACVNAEVRATNRAHRLEHIAGLTLPRNFTSLSAPEQLLVLVDLERVSRGEQPVVGLSGVANAMAQSGARLNQDPSLSNPRAIAGSTGGWTANWAAAVSPLDANYSWMYLDGWAGKGKTDNFTCTSPSARGCWGHRNDILVNSSQLPCSSSRCTLVMGAGYVALNWAKTYNSYTELIVQITGTPPPLVYTWSQAEAAGARA